MHAPPAGMDQRHVQDLHKRFSELSADLSTCLDAVLLELERSPQNPRAVRLARELAGAQYSVTQQLMRLSALDGHSASPSFPRPEQPQPYPLLAAPAVWPNAAAALQGTLTPTQNGHGADLLPTADGGMAGAKSLSELLQERLQHPATAAAPRAHQPADLQVPQSSTFAAPYQPAYQHAPSPHVARVPDYRPRPAPVVELSPASLPNSHEMVWTTPQPQLTPLQAAPAHPLPAAAAPVPSAPHASPAPKQPELPVWMAPVPGWASLYSPTRAAVALISMLAALIFMLNAGQKAPSTDAAEPVIAQQDKPAGGDKKLAGKVPLGAAAPASILDAQAEDVTSGTAADQVATPAPPPASTPQRDEAADAAASLTAVTPAYAEALKADAGGTAQNLHTPSAPAAIPQPPTAPASRREAAATPAAPAPVASSEQTTASLRDADTPPPKPPAQKPKPEKLTTAAPPAPPKAAPQAAKPVAPFKTAVVTAPQPKEQFAPVLLQLKNSASLIGMFQDLQRRHPTLAGKKAELRPTPGPDGEPWMSLLAVPAMSREQAEAVCRDMGPEGRALGCRVTPY